MVRTCEGKQDISERRFATALNFSEYFLQIKLTHTCTPISEFNHLIKVYKMVLIG